MNSNQLLSHASDVLGFLSDTTELTPDKKREVLKIAIEALRADQDSFNCAKISGLSQTIRSL